MTAIEVEGKTLQEALEKGLNQLNVMRDEVDYELLQAPAAGFFGIGRKMARVRITLKENNDNVKNEEKVASVVRASNTDNEIGGSGDNNNDGDNVQNNKIENENRANNYHEDVDYDKERVDSLVNDGDRIFSRSAGDFRRSNGDYGLKEFEDYETRVWEPHYGAFEASEEDKAALEAGEALIYKICEYMKLDVKLTKETTEYGYTIHIDGTDLGILIGKHGQTLDAIQYLANIAANKNREQERVRILLDVEDYRARRDDTLKRLAMRLSKKAVIENHEVRLEPMSRHERKVIHTVLQGNRRISTYSDGEEPYRSIIIVPRRRFDRYDRD